MTPFDALGSDTVSVAKLLENISTFDRPVSITDGIANPGPTPLAQVREQLLELARPDYRQQHTGLESEPGISVLFRQTDEIDRARGIEYLREPSEAMQKYREYELSFRALVSQEASKSGMWRLIPSLSRFSSIDEAKASILSDWTAFGYKMEIEKAQQLLESRTNSAAWKTWTTAQASFNNTRTYINPDTWVPLTILFPPPSEWLNMGTWLRASSSSTIPNTVVLFQVARVKIIRPWLALDSILDGKLRIGGSKDALAKAALISDGTPPTVLTYPHGSLAVIPEELILVRNIRFVAKDIVPEQRIQGKGSGPLGLFSYPDNVNLLGYVVRAIPKVSK